MKRGNAGLRERQRVKRGTIPAGNSCGRMGEMRDCGKVAKIRDVRVIDQDFD